MPEAAGSSKELDGLNLYSYVEDLGILRIGHVGPDNAASLPHKPRADNRGIPATQLRARSRARVGSC